MAGEKILVVEDNPVNRRLVEFLLRSNGYRVHQVATAEDAFEALQDDRPHLILMDLRLPGTDGLTATMRLKADPATRDIPVLAVTAYAMPGDREQALAAGCAGYITKPIDPGMFLREVASFLDTGTRTED